MKAATTALVLDSQLSVKPFAHMEVHSMYKMQNPAQSSSWTGPARTLVLASAVLLSTACAPLQSFSLSDQQALTYWAEAVDADAQKRAQMLEAAREQDDGWKIAMLRSLPGPEHLDAATTRSTLKTLINTGLTPNREALARLRSEELATVSGCYAEKSHARSEVIHLRSEVNALRAKVSQIADIEGQLANAP